MKKIFETTEAVVVVVVVVFVVARYLQRTPRVIPYIGAHPNPMNKNGGE
jgi:hypothetical protein